MSQVNGKYLKDENGNIFSPIVGVNSVIGGKLHPTLLDVLHPVGEYYETSNTEFDPNVTWGGTWVQDTRGLVTVGCYEEGMDKPNNDRLYIVNNSVYGEATTTVNFNHTHPQTQAFTANYVYMSGLKYQDGETTVESTVATQYSDWSTAGSTKPVAGQYLPLGDKTWSNIQPSIGVIRWHRTA